MIDLLQGPESIPETPVYVMIHVVNRNPFLVEDRFDGVPVRFPPGEKVSISPSQAQHFFGFPGTPDEMAVHMAKRFGWNTIEYVQRPPGTLPHEPMLFQKYAANIQIQPIEMELVPKQRQLADDGLAVETLPQKEPELPRQASPAREDPGASKVGVRSGSPVRRKPGRPRKNLVTPDPNFQSQG